MHLLRLSLPCLTWLITFYLLIFFQCNTAGYKIHTASSAVQPSRRHPLHVLGRVKCLCGFYSC